MSPAEAKAWQEDLRFMTSEMERTHKSLYHSISARDFSAMIKTLDEKIPRLTGPETIVEMAKIVASVGDGHTNIYPTRDSKIGFHTIPVAFTYFVDQLYVRSVPPEQRRLLGAKVIRIGNLSVEDAYTATKAMTGHENEGGARYWAQYLLAIPEVLEALHITSSVEDVPLTLTTDQGPMNVTLHPFAVVDVMSGDTSNLFYRREGWMDIRDLQPSPDPAWLREIQSPFRLEHIGDLLYVRINTINDAPNQTLAQFAERIREEIAATKPDKVAIDLRQNRGGNGTLIPPIIRSIIRSENIDRPGHLFGIIGPATFSAAQMLADALETYTKILFVGEPTGSRGNAYGDSRRIVLPNSGITVRAAIYYWQDWHPLDKREATMPQIPATLTLEDYSHKTDPALHCDHRVQSGQNPLVTLTQS
jgi:hypothetical protein